MSNILQVGPMMPTLAQSLRDDYGAVVLPSDPGEREAFLNKHGDEITAVVTSVVGGADADLIAALPNLAVIVNFGVGYDSVDIDAAVRRGIVVSNTPDVLTDAVADTAVGLMIDTLRQFSAADRFVRAGRWPHGMYPLTREVSNSRVGILGLGRIGSAIAKRLNAFGCEISYHNRRPVADSPHRYAASAEELARGVDVLIVATAGGGDTANLVDRAVLDALGPDGYLINIARGSVVDEQAMVEALTSGRLGGAGLDVYADEPHVPEPLLGLDNVVVLPHVGSATVQTRAAMAALTLRNLDSFLKTGRLVTPVPECRKS
ncbi:2-hydroxyacid dehydrogenase [Mycobacterium sp. 852002-51961_SCH5331710]|uniref:2-hydroxyacid dehydrogenase n=1 Tax=Mycobacterium sp. 852002-51961_SCH5331710 TaxID=1834105 RepID=UPI0007FF49B6|nr:2-hydroxyacid dehydrogenase [Mycobacterium sp. 852002-51961_SCH5331710]OBB35875.1 hydroxyacid dehydrogenase [Mycobacterium sp. 852002-51961_SCH5331710]